MTIGGLAFRKFPKGFIFDVSGCSIFTPEEEDLLYLQAILNSRLKEPFVYAITQSVNYEVGIINNFPITYPRDNTSKARVIELVKNCIQIAKEDWDKSEVSWMFQRSNLLNGKKVKDSFFSFQSKVQKDLVKLYENEVELNEILLKTYEYLKEFK